MIERAMSARVSGGGGGWIESGWRLADADKVRIAVVRVAMG
jgi:hypothetical protein